MLIFVSQVYHDALRYTRVGLNSCFGLSDPFGAWLLDGIHIDETKAYKEHVCVNLSSVAEDSCTATY